MVSRTNRAKVEKTWTTTKKLRPERPGAHLQFVTIARLGWPRLRRHLVHGVLFRHRAAAAQFRILNIVTSLRPEIPKMPSWLLGLARIRLPFASWPTAGKEGMVLLCLRRRARDRILRTRFVLFFDTATARGQERGCWRHARGVRLFGRVSRRWKSPALVAISVSASGRKGVSTGWSRPSLTPHREV